MVKIAIIGGTGNFGRIFARLFKEEGHEVVITGRDVLKGERVAGEEGVRFSNDNIKAAKESDVVIISVYIENTIDVIKQVAPHVRPGCLLMDFTSVKVEPTQAMLKHAKNGVEIIGTHPMFGPRTRTIEGLTFIITPVRTGKWEGFIKEFLEKQKSKVIWTTPEEHDRIMGVVQGLTHFTYIAIASTLRELEIDVKQSRKFASPIYELMLDLVARIVGQSPQLYASIQMHNPKTDAVRRTFINEIEKLNQIIENRDMGAFKEIMSKSAKHLDDIDASMGRSDKAILALREELKKLSDSIGREVALKHIYSGAVHVGTVKEVDPEKVVLETSGASSREILLKLSNVELLDEKFLKKWKQEHLPGMSRDFSFMFPVNTDEEIIRKCIESTGDIISCKIIDIYKGKQIPEGKKSITFRVEALDFDFSTVETLLKGIGGVLR